MFGYKKGKVEEGLRRSARAVLIGGLFTHEQAASYGLNDEASAWLYTEIQIQLLYCIGIVYKAKIVGKKPWATTQLGERFIKEEIEYYEQEQGLTPGTIVSYTFKRLYEIDNMSTDQRGTLTHLKNSVDIVKRKDGDADTAELLRLFEAKTREFFGMLMERF